MKLFTPEEKSLIYELVIRAIKNGNTVNPIPSVPTPEQYKELNTIANKLEENPI